MAAVRKIRSDYSRYKKYGSGFVRIVFLTQGFWALFQYRAAHGIYSSKLPFIVKKPLLIFCVLWQKAVEIMTGISIPYNCSIGDGFYIGHQGNIILSDSLTIGSFCNVSQGVTIGISGRGDKRGLPVIGNRVYIGANAVVAGKIIIGDDSVIGANSLVTDDVEQGTTVVGVPAVKVSERGSAEYIFP